MGAVLSDAAPLAALAIEDPRRQDRVASLAVSPIYLSYPPVFQRDLMPQDVLGAMEQRWGMQRYVLPNVDLYRLKNVFVLAEGLVFTAAGHLIRCSQTGHTEEETQAAAGELQRLLASWQTLPSAPRGVLCKKRGAGNYGHWLVEMLPKAFLARRELGLGDWPLVVHQTGPDMASVMRESLEALDFPASQMLVTGAGPVHFDELVIVDGLTVHSVFISPLVMECMEAIRARASYDVGPRIYAPRRPATTRDFDSEPAIRDFLLRQGYAEVVTAQLPFLAQVGVFRHASRVVGPMGAALSNIIFAAPGTDVITFGPASAREVFFWLIAEGRRLSYHEVRCEETGPQTGPLPWDRSLRISVPAVAQVLAQVDARRAVPLLRLEAAAPPVPLTEAQVTAAPWIWRYSAAPEVAHRVTLRPGGGIAGYDHPNERRWRLESGFLEILSWNDACSWRFEEGGEAAGRIELHARFRLNPDLRVVLSVVQEAAVPVASPAPPAPPPAAAPPAAPGAGWLRRLLGRLLGRLPGRRGG